MRRHHRWAVASVLLLVSLQSPPGLARTWYIRADGSGDAPTIQAGLDSATAGDDVLVAAGTYNWSTEGMATDQYGSTMLAVPYGVLLHSECWLGASSTWPADSRAPSPGRGHCVEPIETVYDGPAFRHQPA